MIAQNLTSLIGNTPILELQRLSQYAGAKARVVAKLEGFNPGGSAKDRVALAMIEDAERKGLLHHGSTTSQIIEPTSGNTGIGIAWIAKVKGYEAVIVMPDSMSVERQQLMRAYGATLVLTPGAEGMAGAIRKAEEMHAVNPHSIIAGQFSNPSNPAAHEQTTGEEIWQQCEGKVDVFVAGVGTGGTVSGVGRALKKHHPAVEIVAVEPAKSPVLRGGKANIHGIQGIGANFVPDNYDATVIDKVVDVSDEDAMRMTHLLVETEGLLVGISSGAAVFAAYQLAKDTAYQGKTIAVLLPDTGERYLSVLCS